VEYRLEGLVMPAESVMLVVGCKEAACMVVGPLPV
jgi:hypothetical protein